MVSEQCVVARQDDMGEAAETMGYVTYPCQEMKKMRIATTLSQQYWLGRDRSPRLDNRHCPRV